MSKLTGFAMLSPEERSRVASLGGQRVQELGTAGRFTSEFAKVVGKIGGEKVSQNREWMKEIGRRGGVSRAAKRKAEQESLVSVPTSDETSE